MDEDFLQYWKYFDYAVILAAILANCYMLLALLLCQIKLPGYRRYLLSITAGDLYTCLVSVLSFAYQSYPPNNQPIPINYAENHFVTETVKCSANVLRSLKLAGFFVHLLNLCGLSFDHVLGTVYPMKYRQFWDGCLLRCIIPITWIASFVLAFFDFPLGIVRYFTTPNRGYPKSLAFNRTVIGEPTTTVSDDYYDVERLQKLLAASYYDSSIEPIKFISSHTAVSETDKKASLNSMLEKLAGTEETDDERMNNVCTLFKSTRIWFELIVIGLAVICLVFLIVCYSIIFKQVKQRMVSSASRQTRKLITGTFIFIGAFIICWGPVLIYEFVTFVDYERSKQLSQNEADISKSYRRFILIGTVLNSVLMIYPLIDPLVYAAKIPAINRMVVNHLATLMPCLIKSVPEQDLQSIYRQDSSAMIASRQTSVSTRTGSTRRIIATAEVKYMEDRNVLQVAINM